MGINFKRLSTAVAVIGLAGLLNVASAFQSPAPWNETTEYKGDYKTGQGDTVTYGKFNGRTLYWWAKFWTKGNIPGMFAPQGGTSPWVLINSDGVSNGKPPADWVGWNGGLESSLGSMQAAIPTWKDGAEGAYTMIHDDIGAMPWDAAVAPALEVLPKYPKVKTAWGVFVRESDDVEFAAMADMVAMGHEMVNHSWNHTSAAEQWLWYYPGDTLPLAETILDRNLTGLVVAPLWPDPADDGSPKWPKPASYTVQNELVSITFDSANAYWTGYDPSTEKSDLGTFKCTITPKAGVETFTLPTGQELYIKYTKKDETGGGENEGWIAPTSVSWYELDWLTKNAPDKVNATVTADQGRPGWLSKLYLVKPWDGPQYDSNIAVAKAIIDEKVYQASKAKYGSFGANFAPNKELQYFVYPYDAYSEVTHDSLEANGYVAGRGGAKSGVAMPGDFFHPYRIDFDAFYIKEGDTSNVINAGGDNPHQLLSLSGLVSEVIAKKGYFIREFHAVCKVDNWMDINTISAGGWWGGVPQDLYETHVSMCSDLIDQNKLAVYTPSEAVKYKMVCNALSGAAVAADGDNYRLSVTISDNALKEKYKDEISVIVKLDAGCDSLGVEYYGGAKDGWSASPRIRPRKLNNDGTAWSVSVNPFLGDAKLIPNGDWDGDVVGIFDNNKVSTKSLKGAKFMGLLNNKLQLSLPAGKFKAEVFTVNGKLAKTISLNSEGGIAKIDLNTNSFANGLYLLKVKSLTNKSNVLVSKFVIK